MILLSFSLWLALSWLWHYFFMGLPIFACYFSACMLPLSLLFKENISFVLQILAEKESLPFFLFCPGHDLSKQMGVRHCEWVFVWVQTPGGPPVQHAARMQSTPSGAPHITPSTRAMKTCALMLCWAAEENCQRRNPWSTLKYFNIYPKGIFFGDAAMMKIQNKYKCVNWTKTTHFLEWSV